MFATSYLVIFKKIVIRLLIYFTNHAHFMALTPRDKDFSARYNELVEQADLAQHSSVR